ncbi:YihY/virulence factor BrkB family protein [Agrilactobacillus yilanensis]|uniref:YihY/virulence factor BrkB family protein n=1 Tax=Agrilactobacillus yilanensis TaxID=2485997 RepID=A0ABW4JAL0_9LACO|nr:YihY/virulence factor BrkB family protein [Agrilactobacillus yilanensis]
MQFFEKVKRWFEAVKAFILAVAARTSVAEVSNNAKVITYYILFSFFPLIIFVGNLLPLLNLNVNSVVSYIHFAMPEEISKNILPIIKSLLTNSSGRLLSIGAITALWGASRGINILWQSVNRAYQIQPQYGEIAVVNAIIKRGIAFLFTLGFILILFAIFMAFIFGQRLLEWLLPIFNLPTTILDTFVRWKWPIAGGVIFIALWLAYFILPNAKVKLLSALPGTVLTSAGWLAISQGFSFYIDHFGSWTSYGTLGIFVIMLFWLNMISMIFMFGAVLNAVIEEYYNGPIEVRQLNELSSSLIKIKRKL